MSYEYEPKSFGEMQDDEERKWEIGTTRFEDAREREFVSDCCSAPIMEFGQSYICSKCKEYCSSVEI